MSIRLFEAWPTHFCSLIALFRQSETEQRPKWASNCEIFLHLATTKFQKLRNPSKSSSKVEKKKEDAENIVVKQKWSGFSLTVFVAIDEKERKNYSEADKHRENVLKANQRDSYSEQKGQKKHT